MAGDDEAPGWAAIEAAFARLYPGAPRHRGTLMPQRVQLGGPEVLDGKVGDDPQWSGWGYEMTMRVPRTDDEPPRWPVNVLRQLANYTHRTSRLLEPGQTVDTQAKVGPEPCALTALAFRSDPELPALDTPHGKVEFVEVVALHPDELRFVKERGVEALVGACAYTGELNVLDRSSSI